MVTPEGDLIDRWVGYNDAFSFMETASQGLSDPITLENRSERYKADATSLDAAVLGRVAGATGEYEEALNYYRNAEKLNDDNGVDFAYEIFNAASDAYGAGKYSFDEFLASADAVIASENTRPVELLFTAYTVSRVAHRAENPKLQERFLDAALSATADTKDEDVRKWRADLEIEQALYIEEDKDKALKIKRANLPEGWMDEPGQLNNFAWFCFEQNINLEEAEQLARKGVELAEPGKEKAMILDTVAEICNTRGACEDAVELVRAALAEDPESDYYKSQLERFEELLASAK